MTLYLPIQPEDTGNHPHLSEIDDEEDEKETLNELKLARTPKWKTRFNHWCEKNSFLLANISLILVQIGFAGK